MESARNQLDLDFSGAKGVVYLSSDYYIIDGDQAPTNKKEVLPACSESAKTTSKSAEPTATCPKSARPTASTVCPASARPTASIAYPESARLTTLASAQV